MIALPVGRARLLLNQVGQDRAWIGLDAIPAPKHAPVIGAALAGMIYRVFESES